MSLSKRVRFEVFKRDNFTCQYCGAKPPDTVLEIDHVHPRCEGGRDHIDNLKTACWNCNRGKGGVPIVLSPLEYELIGGPWNGRTFRFKNQFRFPFLWIVTDSHGVLGHCEDGYVDMEGMSRRMVRGHPLSQWSRNLDGNEFFSQSIEDKRRPQVIGAYATEFEYEPITYLAWRTLDDVVLELSGGAE